MRARAFLLSLMMLAGCASVLGLEDRHLIGNDEDASSVGRDGSTEDSTSPADVAQDATSDGDIPVCAYEGGALVYEFPLNMDYRYRVEGDPSGFDASGSPVFRLVSPDAPGFKKPMYILRANTGPDEAVSPQTFEDSSYSLVDAAPLGHGLQKQEPGTVRAQRWLESGPHHRLVVEGGPVPPAPWADEMGIQFWFVCPL